MSVLLLPPIFQFFDNNGDPLANGFVYTYAAGTNTLLATFTSNTGLIAAPNPIELNAAGRPTSGAGAIWGEGAYKFIVKDSNGVQVGDTLDNVVSFNSLADAANAYAETFSGDGVRTVFTTSQDLGTEEKGLLVSVANGLQEITVNGSFTTDTNWTKGAGWTISGGVATASGAISTAISQVPVISLVPGQAYAVTYTITASAGSLTPSLGGQAGASRTGSGTYREVIVAAATTPIAFTGSGFTGTLDNVSITVATSQPMSLLPVTGYTINGTSLTFTSPPALGVNNIDVRAPSLLLGAAVTAANLAQLYASQALTSETNAATSAQLAALASKWRPAVLVATTANITLSGEQTIDTQLTSGSRVLVKNQTTASQNGVYVSSAGAWTRATDADTSSELLSQSVNVTAGSVNIRKSFANTNDAGFILGTDPVTFTEIFVGFMSTSVYDLANIKQQVVGTTATQTLFNKTLDAATTVGLPVSYSSIAGFLPSSIAGTNTTASLTISTGGAVDSTNAVSILKATTTSWLVSNGNAINGYQGGTTLPNSSTIHFFMVTGTGGTGSFASTSLTPTLPAGYTSYRRVFSLKTSGAGALLVGNSIETMGGSLTFYLAAQIQDIGVTTLGGSAVLYPLTTPGGIKTEVLYRAMSNPGGLNTLILTSPDEVDVAPSATYNAGAPGMDIYSTNAMITSSPLITDTSSQIRARATGSGTNLYFVTRGWIDFRR